MIHCLSKLFGGLSKPKPRDIEELRQGLLRIADSKRKLAPMSELSDHRRSVNMSLFDNLVNEKLTEKGWLIATNENNTLPLTRAFDILKSECELPINFKKCVEEYSKRSHDFQESMAFIMDHKGDIFEVAEELKNFTPADLAKKRTIIIHDNRSKYPGPEAL